MSNRDVDDPPWLRPLARKVGATKWMKSKRRCSLDFYYRTLDAAIELRTASARSVNDAVLAKTVALVIEETGELRANAKHEGVVPASEQEWADMTEAAGWALLERYYKDLSKGKWP